jgi:hypothetical protein
MGEIDNTDAVCATVARIESALRAAVPENLATAVFTVLEGFTLHHGARKILETAYYAAAPQQQQPRPQAPQAAQPQAGIESMIGVGDEKPLEIYSTHCAVDLIAGQAQAAQPVQPSDFSIRPDGKGGTGIFYEPVAQPVQPSEQRDAHFGGSSYEASMLRNLLARIHGDGGQYLAQHGLDKALEAADQLCAVWRAQQAGAALKPLSDAEIAEIILQEQFLLVVDDEESFTEIVRAIERAHHIREN